MRVCICACVFTRVCERASVGACVCVWVLVWFVFACLRVFAHVWVCVSGCVGVSAYVGHLRLYVCVYVLLLVPA